MAKREVKKVLSKSNCNCIKQEIYFELNFSLSFADLPYFFLLGYEEKKSYTNSGLFYIGSKDLIAFGAVGSNKLRIKCKNVNCFNRLDELEAQIKEM